MVVGSGTGGSPPLQAVLPKGRRLRSRRGILEVMAG
jgi:hypothetical protein